MTRRTERRLVSCAAWACLAVVGCGGDGGSGVGASKLPQGVRTEAVEHEACSESGNRVEVLDANGDGKPDIKRVYDKGSGKEVCRITDLNHDGKADLYEYYDSSGVLRRREADYDSNGVIDSIEYFEGGKLVRREYDTTGQNRIDTWDYFDASNGKRTRRERDTNNDGKVDQWWLWEGDRVTITTDKNGDGRPDPDTVLVLSGGADGGIGPVVSADAGSPGDAGAPAEGGAGPTSAPAPVVAPPVVASLPAAAGTQVTTGLDSGAPTGDAGARTKGKGH